MIIENEYDKLIYDKLGSIPKSTTLIKALDDLLTIELSEDDKKTFSLLYSLRPTTINGKENNQNVGSGEVGIYWLLKYNNHKFNVSLNSKTDSKLPDLTINDVGFEVKAYDNSDSYIKIGSISRKKYDYLLEIFNISNAIATINSFSGSKYYSTLSINSSNLNQVFENVYEVKSQLPHWSGSYHNNINNAISRIEYIYKDKTSNPLPDNSSELTKFFISEVIKTKLIDKPGINGYISNILQDSTMSTYKVTREWLESNDFREKCVKYAKIDGNVIMINFAKFFGMAK